MRRELPIPGGAWHVSIAGYRSREAVIAAVNPTPVSAWPIGWEDVEVVDSVLVGDPAGGRPAAADPAPARLYDGSGRIAGAARVGRLVSVLA
jgi:hypothetical protein